MACWFDNLVLTLYMLTSTLRLGGLCKEGALKSRSPLPCNGGMMGILMAGSTVSSSWSWWTVALHSKPCMFDSDEGGSVSFALCLLAAC